PVRGLRFLEPSPAGRGQGEGAGPAPQKQHPHPGPLPEGEGEAAAERVMIAPWPEADLSLVDEGIEARVARFQTVLGGLREMRARQGIAPKANVQFQVRCDAATTALLEPMRPYFVSMAAATVTEIGPAVAGPPLSAHFTGSGIDVYV